jgi:hypothetical protein
MFAVLLNIFKCKEITACVIEYTIENNFDLFFMTGCYKVLKVFVRPETGIQLFVICGFIAMSYTLE